MPALWSSNLDLDVDYCTLTCRQDYYFEYLRSMLHIVAYPVQLRIVIVSWCLFRRFALSWQGLVIEPGQVILSVVLCAISYRCIFVRGTSALLCVCAMREA